MHVKARFESLLPLASASHMLRKPLRLLLVPQETAQNEKSANSQIDTSDAVLCFCTSKFFESGPCMQELVRGVLRGKPIVTVLEEDAARGGLTEAEVASHFTNEAWTDFLDSVRNRLGRTGGPGTLRDRIEQQWAEDWKQEGMKAPTGDEMRAAMFESAPIVWFRLSDLQDVTMRLIAERLLCAADCRTKKGPASMPCYDEDYDAKVYIKGEIAARFGKEPQCKLREQTIRLYCSGFNPGASELVTNELRSVAPRMVLSSSLEDAALFVVYMTSETWKGEHSDQMAAVVETALDSSKKLLLVHEMMPRLRARDLAGCSERFEDILFLTPTQLVSKGLYKQIASPLAYGEWRECGMLRLALKIQRLVAPPSSGLQGTLASVPVHANRKSSRVAPSSTACTNGAQIHADELPTLSSAVDDRTPVVTAGESVSLPQPSVKLPSLIKGHGATTTTTTTTTLSAYGAPQAAEPQAATQQAVRAHAAAMVALSRLSSGSRSAAPSRIAPVLLRAGIGAVQFTTSVQRSAASSASTRSAIDSEAAPASAFESSVQESISNSKIVPKTKIEPAAEPHPPLDAHPSNVTVRRSFRHTELSRFESSGQGHTQWDGVGLTHVLSDLSHLLRVRKETTLLPGLHGGGGVNVSIPDLAESEESRAREVIAACARVWICNHRKTSKTRRFSVTAHLDAQRAIAEMSELSMNRRFEDDEPAL